MAYGARRRRGHYGTRAKSHKRRRKESLKATVERILTQNAELKAIDTDLTTQLVATTRFIWGSIAQVAQDVSENGRIGRKIVIKSIGMRMGASLPVQVDGANAFDTYRLMVIHVKNTCGLNVTFADLLNNVDVYSFNNLRQKQTITVLYDRIVDINSNGGINSATPESMNKAITHQFYKKVNIEIEFSGAGGLIAENLGHSIQVVAISLAGRTRIAGTTRVRYLDL